MAEYSATTPVLVGIAAVQQTIEDYQCAREPLVLMEQALRAAAVDAGSMRLLSLADEILVPKSLWSYTDPGRLLAAALGAYSATTLLAEFGILQQTLLTRACQRIKDGDAEVMLVAGGEARFRALCAGKAGVEAFETPQNNAEPDIRMRCGHRWSQTAVWVCLSVTTLSSIARCATNRV